MVEWLVDVADAYAKWMRESRPSLEAELAMIVWVVQRERHGPPSTVGYSSGGLQIARGPNREVIEFAVVARPLGPASRPPWGVIAIHGIVSDARGGIAQ